MSESTDDIKRRMKRKKRRKRSAADWLSTGSTQLNLALSGRYNRGFLKGMYYWLVGDSRSGKTFLALTCFAEAAKNKNFENHRLIYDNAEDGALMDIGRYFGTNVEQRLEPPGFDEDGQPAYSYLIEEFYYYIDDAISQGQPFIYVLDSMDSLTSNAETKKFSEMKSAYRKGNKAPGEMTDGKAKKNSSGVRQMLSRIKKTESIVIIISQTRDNMGGFGGGKTTAGGHALRFYATAEIWSRVGKPLKKTVRNKPRVIGTTAELQTKKNRHNGRDRKVSVPIYYEMGFDDVGGCINYLIDEGHWTKRGATVRAPEFEFKGRVNDLVAKIEAEDMERDLQLIVQEVWDEIEAACSETGRKRRYE